MLVPRGDAFGPRRRISSTETPENARPLRVATLPRARADRLSPVRGICMKSMVAAHLSFLITLHQAASLSRTVAAMSWGEPPRRAADAPRAAGSVPSSGSAMRWLVLVSRPVAG